MSHPKWISILLKKTAFGSFFCCIDNAELHRMGSTFPTIYFVFLEISPKIRSVTTFHGCVDKKSIHSVENKQPDLVAGLL